MMSMLPTPTVRRFRALIALPLGFLIPVPAALAHTSTGGGAAAPDRPEVSELTCDTGEQARCARGSVLKLAGENLQSTSGVLFLGGPGTRDDRRARPEASTPHRLTVRVPGAARSGPVRVVTSIAGTSGPSPRLRVLVQRVPPAPAITPTPTAGDGVFPVLGRHDFGGESNRFGGGRNHKGQDIFAACGTPVVAALAGDVAIAKFHDRAGNYAVITADDGTSQAYMHLRAPASIKRGQRVAAGQQIGLVGQTGRASGCHLHFELWTAPGWYEGGEAVDPLPDLQRWDGAG